MTLVRSQQPVRPSVTIETVLSFYRICADRITAFFSQVQTALLVALCAVLKTKQVAATPTSATDDVAGKVSRNENSSKMILCSAMCLMCRPTNDTSKLCMHLCLICKLFCSD